MRRSNDRFDIATTDDYVNDQTIHRVTDSRTGATFGVTHLTGTGDKLSQAEARVAYTLWLEWYAARRARAAEDRPKRRYRVRKERAT